jgi:hypothetical protein
LKKFIIIFLTILFFLDVYSTHNYIGILLGLSILLWYPFEFIKIKRPEIFLILFGITYVFFASYNVQIRFSAIFEFTLLPLIVFKIGKLSIGLLRTEKNIVLFLFISLVALSFLFLYSVLIEYINEGVNSTRIAEIKFRSRSVEVLELNATLVGLHIVPLMSFMPLYFFQRTGELTKYFFLGSFLTISALMVTTLLATRTPIIILGVLLLINFYYGLKKVKYSSKAVILILFSAIIYSVSALDFANFELTSFLYERMTSDDLTVAGSRTEMWLLGLENIFIYPLGGEKLNINYFHNLWLDLRYEAGVVPMIFLILLSFIFNYSCWRVVMSELFTIQFKFFIGSVYLTLFLMMFVEPVIQGSFVFFLYYIFFGGVLTALKDFKFNRVDF